MFAEHQEQDGQWVAAHTRPRQEKALAFDLLQAEVPYFLPMVEKATVSGGRKRRGMHPLFASYLFFVSSESTRVPALRTNRIVQLIEPSEHEQPRFLEELATLEAALLSAPEKLELNPRIVDGARARVRCGALKGFEGVVLRSEQRAKIQLKVTALGTSVLYELPADYLDPLD